MFATINQKPRVQEAPAPSLEFTQAVQAVDAAFVERPDLRDGLLLRLKTSRDTSDLTFFNDLAFYVQDLRKRPTAVVGGEDAAGAPAAKKRKLEGQIVVNGLPSTGTTDPSSLQGSWSASLFDGVSFTVPQRKKLSLEISAKPSQGIRALNASTKETEFGIPWGEAEHVVCVPVPEKAQPQKNFCVFPRNGDGLSDASSNPFEVMVWTGADTIPRGASEDTKTQATTILEALKAAQIRVLEPSEDEFASEIPQPHRKGEKAYHVKAFRGSKDGYLFFLSTGILWGFKKPLMFFAFASIDSISYTAILQRTFNLNIMARPVSSDAEPVEYEFSMLDQADFAGIDGYIKKHSLQDSSMAEQRRAKKLNINGIRGQKGEEGAEGEEEESELQKAHREAEMQADDDEDDEEDDNFDPGSEGESEGSGTSDDESGDEAEGNGSDEGDEDEDE